MQAQQDYWRKCSTCKKPIGFKQKYFVCSVSTCNNQRTGYVFCSVTCCESHMPGARHRDAWSIEKTSPSEGAAPLEAAGPHRIIVQRPQTSSSATSSAAKNGLASGVSVPIDILIVASKLKDYIKAKGDMNTSASVMEVLSELVRRHCDAAIDHARSEGRKTVMDRDFKK